MPALRDNKTPLATVPAAIQDQARPDIDRVPHVLTAMSEVMKGLGAVGGITKGRENKEQHYAFRGIDDVYNTLNGLLTSNGLLILPSVVATEFRERKTSGGKPVNATFLTVDLTFTSVRDGSTQVVRTVGEGADMSDKGANKAMSAAYKYACIMVFCIPTDGISEDADADTIEMRGYDKDPEPPARAQLAPPAEPTVEDLKIAAHRLSRANAKVATLDEFNRLWASEFVSGCYPYFDKQQFDALEAEKRDKEAELVERGKNDAGDGFPGDDNNGDTNGQR